MGQDGFGPLPLAPPVGLRVQVPTLPHLTRPHHLAPYPTPPHLFFILTINIDSLSQISFAKCGSAMPRIILHARFLCCVFVGCGPYPIRGPSVSILFAQESRSVNFVCFFANLFFVHRRKYFGHSRRPTLDPSPSQSRAFVNAQAWRFTDLGCFVHKRTTSCILDRQPRSQPRILFMHRLGVSCFLEFVWLLVVGLFLCTGAILRASRAAGPDLTIAIIYAQAWCFAY